MDASTEKATMCRRPTLRMMGRSAFTGTTRRRDTRKKAHSMRQAGAVRMAVAQFFH
jgi:hypothetical protein